MWRSSDKGDDGRKRHMSYSFGRSNTTKSKYTNMLKPQPNAKIGYNAKLGGIIEEYGK